MANTDGATTASTEATNPPPGSAEATEPTEGKTPAAEAPKTGDDDIDPDAPLAGAGDVNLTGQDEGGEELDAAGPWGDDWREKIANGDNKVLKRLQRFASPQALWQRMEHQERAIRSRREIPEPPGPDASDEDRAKYRQAMGLPETSDGYLEHLQLSDGKVIGEDDMPYARSFAETLHAANAPQEAVNAAVDWYLSAQEQMAAQMIEADDRNKQESRDQLRDEWGGDFKSNINAIGTLFTEAPGGVNPTDPSSLMSRVITARTQDGRVLGDDPDFVKWLSGTALNLNPQASITPRTEADIKGVREELAELRKLVANDQSEYWQGPKASQLQARFAELVEIEQRLNQS